MRTSPPALGDWLAAMAPWACIVEFLVVDAAATSAFFFIMVGSLIDVVAGFTIGIRVARRDLAIGGVD